MKSLFELIEKVKDPNFTKKNASALISERVAEMVNALNYSEIDARRVVLHNLGYATAYYPHEIADRVFEVYATEHPIFGRRHPPAEEIIQMEITAGQKTKKGESIDS